MEANRLGHSLSRILIGVMALVVGCGDSQSDDGDGASGATGGTAGEGSSGSGGSSMSGSGGNAPLAGRGGSSGAGLGGGSAANAGQGGSGGTSGSAGASPVPDAFPKGFGPVETVLDGLTSPARIQFRDGYLYFTELGTAGVQNSRLARLGATGVVETLLEGLDIGGMFLDEDELFVSERGTRKVFRMPYATLTPELFVQAELMVADMERIGERIWLTLFDHASPASTQVYGLDRTTKERADLLKLSTGTDVIFTYLSSAGENLYLSTLPLPSGSGNNEGLYKRGPTKVGITVPGIWANHTSTDASHVYFSDQTTGLIFRQAHTADNQPEVLATGQASPYHVQVTSDGIYWSNSTNCDESDTRPGSIQALPLSGGTPVPVATNETCAGAIVTDVDYVYWTRTLGPDGVGDDSIVRAPKLR